jgi:hypothetical protein
MPHRTIFRACRLSFIVVACLAAATIGAAPSANDEVERIFALARKASGSINWDNPGALIETGTEKADGMEARWRLVTDLRSGRMRQSAEFPLFQSAEVWADKDRWRQDRSGGVHALNSRFALENTVTEKWLARRGHLQPGVAGARIEYLGEQKDGEHTANTLRATPVDGQPVELWFDSESGLLSKSVWLMPTRTRTISYQDYRSAGTLNLPGKIVIDEGTGNNDVILMERAELAGGVAEREFVRPATPDDFIVAGGVVTVPITFDGDVIVEAMLNGQGPYAFILDTGGHDILTPEAAKALNLTAIGGGKAGGAGEELLNEQYTRVERMEIGGVTLRDQSFAIIPLQYDTVERGAKPPLAGILGLELFERLAIRLDYRAQTLTMRPLEGAPEGRGIPVPIYFTDDMPLFSAKIGGIEGDNGLDTGNSGTLVVQGKWADANGLGPQMRSGYQTSGFGSGGVTQSWASRVELEVAGTRFPRIVCYYSSDKKGAFSSTTEAGNVGNDIYANFVLSFDYERNEVWFEPSPGFSQRPYGRIGMSLYKESNDTFTVATVAPDTPAADAGFMSGDKVTAIAGVSAAALSGWDLRRLVRETPGTKLTFEYERKGEKRSVVVTLRELLP